ncbi:hypothetical protein GCM10029978_065080 [Actinoallomurus acanthiterrae]
MVENFNSASKDLFYGKAGELTGDDRENVDVSAFALHLVAATITYLNTLLIQIILKNPPGGGGSAAPTGVACRRCSGHA